MKKVDKARLLAKLDEPSEVKIITRFSVIEDPKDTIHSTSVDRNSAIQGLIDELRADRDAKDMAITRRLEQAIAKEEGMQALLASQKQFVAELLEKGDASGELVSSAVAAKALDLAPRTLRFYADQGIIPCLRIGKHRRYNLSEIQTALELARKEHRAPISDAVRKRILR